MNKSDETRTRPPSELRTIDLNGTRLYAVIGQGDTDRPPLLLINGLGANLAARVSGLAPPGTIVISDAVAPLIRNAFELVPCEPAAVKGVAEPIVHHRVLGERAPLAVAHASLVGRTREFGRLHDSWTNMRSLRL